MKPISPEWTAEERLRVISAILPSIQTDIYTGRYSEPGRPNLTTIQHIIVEPAQTLEVYRAEIEAQVRAWEASLGADHGDQ